MVRDRVFAVISIVFLLNCCSISLTHRYEWLLPTEAFDETENGMFLGPRGFSYPTGAAAANTDSATDSTDSAAAVDVVDAAEAEVDADDATQHLLVDESGSDSKVDAKRSSAADSKRSGTPQQPKPRQANGFVAHAANGIVAHAASPSSKLEDDADEAAAASGDEELGIDSAADPEAHEIEQEDSERHVDAFLDDKGVGLGGPGTPNDPNRARLRGGSRHSVASATTFASDALQGSPPQYYRRPLLGEM